MYPIYELQIKPLSSWIGDLTADVVFGHLCWMMRYELGESVLISFLEQMEASPIVTISDVLPTDRIPKPLSVWDAVYDPQETNQLRMIKKNKDYKQIRFVPRSRFFDTYINYGETIIHEAKDGLDSNRSKDIIGVEDYTGNMIDRNTGTTGENSIYSLSYNYIKDRSFSLFIKVFDEDMMQRYNLKELIKKTCEIGIGKKKSTGKGVFSIKQDRALQEDMTQSKGTHQVLLSNCIPSKEDPTQGAYALYTKFGKLSESYSIAGKNFYKKPVVFIERGSCFENDDKGYMGRMIPNIAIEQPGIYQYGYGFTLNF